MQQRMEVGSLVLVAWLCISGCGSSGPSLTGEELQKKYPEEKYVQIDGVSLHYRQEGLGRPLILLHGLPTYSYLWREIIPGLTYGNTIYALDLMGSGLSEKPQHQTYSVETYVSQLSKFIDNFHLENPILVGHDVGGVIVTLYAVRNPGKVRKLIVMNAPVYPLSPPLSVRLMGAPVIGGLFSGDWAIRRIIRGGAVKQQSMTDSLLDAYLKPYHDDLGARAVLRKQLSELNLQPIVEKEIVPNLSKLQLPTLIMWGDGDPYVPLDFGKKLDEQIPDSSLYVVLNTGHFAIEERPEDVRQALKEFIDKQ